MPEVTLSPETHSECFEMAAPGKHFPGFVTVAGMIDPINPGRSVGQVLSFFHPSFQFYSAFR
jgi:hypothetical protein